MVVYQRGKMKSLGASYKCKDCQDIYRLKGKEAFDTVVDEAFFSWSSCDNCNSDLGGNRYIGHEIVDGEIVHVEICEDCIEEYS